MQPRRRPVRAVALLALVAGWAAQGARAEPLADVVAARPCSSIPGDRVAAAGNCRVTAQPRGLAVMLRAAAGTLGIGLPAGIPLPGGAATGAGSVITVGGLLLYNGTLAPEVWRIRAGDTLQIRLDNALPAGEHAATNLHTHGLLVRPTLALTPDGRAREPVGDTVYVCTTPGDAGPTGTAACTLHGAVLGAAPSRMAYALATRPDHPPGLYWYHPHLHGNARAQVGAGMAGLIWIEQGDRAGRRPAEHAAPAERFLLLKDLQLEGVTGTPESLAARVLPAAERDADLCAGAALPLPGACFTAEGKGWLFTVNGQVVPTIAVPPGGREVWRIANVSADATYDLALVERGTGRPLHVQVIASDGAVARTGAVRGAALTERVLLMPGARVELAVSRAIAEGRGGAEDRPLSAVLRSYGYDTGGATPEAGDNWPAVDLASVEFGAAGSAAPPVAAVRTAAAAVPAEPGGVAAGAAANGHAGHAVASRAAPDCRPLPPGTDRIIALTIRKPAGGRERFMIGASRARRDDPRALAAAVDRALRDARVFGDSSALLCARAGRTETWTIVNPRHAENDELHNFHIHQMKFEVLEVVDPAGRIAAPGPGVPRMVDSYPVPIDGSLRIRIAFNAQQTGGRFVFHCHILEHEDKGMMAEIQVLLR